MIKLGILGMSEGNGHPYSWSAICNGYNKKYMDECPFPVIPQYLYQEKFPDNFIKDARVTHVWSQERAISEHIANASNIENVVDDYSDMIGKVDAVLLARDDAENHLEMSKSFLEAGLMIYIDKPFSLSRLEAEKIYSYAKYEEQIFSCSALAYAKEVEAFIADKASMGDIKYIEAFTCKSWKKYSPHVIDPILRVIGECNIVDYKKFANDNVKGVLIKNQNDIIINFTAHKKTPIPIGFKVYGENGYKEVIFKDTFYAFRGALQSFVDSVKNRKSKINKATILNMIDILEKGR